MPCVGDTVICNGDGVRHSKGVMISFLKKLENKNLYHLRYGNEVMVRWCKKYFSKIKIVLDVGSGDCRDLSIINKHCNISLCVGIDRCFFHDCFNVVCADIEKSNIPISDESADLIICHEVLEHCKNIHCIKSEMARILKSGGYAIIGTPNLAAWHERAMLLFGKQPTEIRSIGYHIRGFTRSELIKFCIHGGMFELVECKMIGFRPLYGEIFCRILSILFPFFAMNTLLLLKRTLNKPVVSYTHKSTYGRDP